jgi:hypothetical protein
LFKIETFIETGTFKGINAELHSKNFKEVYTCEKIEEYYKKSFERLNQYPNVKIFKMDSAEFLKKWRKMNLCKYKCNKKYVMMYCDAHFFNPKDPPKKGKFQILKELKKLKNMDNVIIIIHDFKNGLGGITYDGIDLNFELLKKDLLNVNPNFVFYTNELGSCSPVTLNYKDITNSGLHLDEETINNLEYAWKEPKLTYRGILYCLPKEVKIDGLRKI